LNKLCIETIYVQLPSVLEEVKFATEYTGFPVKKKLVFIRKRLFFYRCMKHFEH